jgi:hypothetical protein
MDDLGLAKVHISHLLLDPRRLSFPAAGTGNKLLPCDGILACCRDLDYTMFDCLTTRPDGDQV